MRIETFVVNPFMENTYLLIDDESKKCVVIDAGCMTGTEQEELAYYIDKENLKLERVLNTHLHIDHCFGNRFLAERYGVLPEASEADEYLLKEMNDYARRFGIDYQGDYQPLLAYLHDADTITVGSIEITVIEVPGHSAGGLAFYLKKEGILFSGDSLFQNCIGRTDISGGDFDTLISSLEKKILTLPPQTVVYPGHGEKTTIADELEYNPYF
ncbi:MAG: MBL fold metallo-hydrolase [Paludibacteraceae bacterium]|nr:MBL fold metallo-hydrolase [Paludibacteraceae bacterium]